MLGRDINGVDNDMMHVLYTHFACSHSNVNRMRSKFVEFGEENPVPCPHAIAGGVQYLDHHLYLDLDLGWRKR